MKNHRGSKRLNKLPKTPTGSPTIMQIKPWVKFKGVVSNRGFKIDHGLNKICRITTQAIGIACVVMLQILFSQWSILNPLFDTIPLNFTQGSLCVIMGLPVGLLGRLFRRFDPL